MTDDDAVAEKHKLWRVAARFSEDTGYIWVKYSSQAYDETGEVTTGSWNILTKWELEKQDGRWVVTNVNEAP